MHLKHPFNPKIISAEWTKKGGNQSPLGYPKHHRIWREQCKIWSLLLPIYTHIWILHSFQSVGDNIAFLSIVSSPTSSHVGGQWLTSNFFSRGKYILNAHGAVTPASIKTHPPCIQWLWEPCKWMLHGFSGWCPFITCYDTFALRATVTYLGEVELSQFWRVPLVHP